MKCTFCGFDGPADEYFCSECGQPRAAADARDESTPQTPASARSAPPRSPTSAGGARALEQASLVGLDGPLENVEFPLDRPEIRIGRQADCDIAVVDENVSRMHSLIRQTPTGLEITDLGSSNGTWLNGVK